MSEFFAAFFLGWLYGHLYTAFHLIYIAAIPMPREKKKDGSV